MLGGKVLAPTPTYLLAVGGIILYIRHMIGVAFGKRVSLTLSTHSGTTSQSTNRLLHLLILSSMYLYAQGYRREFPIGSWR